MVHVKQDYDKMNFIHFKNNDQYNGSRSGEFSSRSTAILYSTIYLSKDRRSATDDGDNAAEASKAMEGTSKEKILHFKYRIEKLWQKYHRSLCNICCTIQRRDTNVAEANLIANHVFMILKRNLNITTIN